MTIATELAHHRRALDLLGAWTAADELRPAVAETVAAWCGATVTLFSGYPPSVAPRVRQPVVAGRAAADMLDHYQSEGFAAADPFAGPLARAHLRHGGAVALEELGPGPDQHRYAEQFLHRHRVHHQLTVWIDTRSPLHAYLSVLSPRPLPADVRPTLLLVRGHLGGLLRRAPSTHRAAPDWSALTPRERQVADLVAAGECNRAIARRLGVAEHTVKRHLTHVYAKLDIDSRTRLAVAHPTTKVAYRDRSAGPMLGR